MMVGQAYSTSRNARVIRFQGGPWDGQEGLYDHDHYNSIAVCYSEERKTYSYKRIVDSVFALDSEYAWSPQP